MLRRHQWRLGALLFSTNQIKLKSRSDYDGYSKNIAITPERRLRLDLELLHLNPQDHPGVTCRPDGFGGGGALDDHEKFAFWLEHAQYDLDSAKVMLDSGRWLYVVFMCQQAVEKLVKGLYGMYLDFDQIPRIHNIRAIFERFQDKLVQPIPQDNVDLFDSLTRYYLNNRYPDYVQGLLETTKWDRAEDILRRTREVFAWLLTLKP